MPRKAFTEKGRAREEAMKGREDGPPPARVNSAPGSKLFDLMKVGRAAATRAVKGGLSQAGSEALASPTVWFSTGSLSLDRLCRGYNPGGFPAGRVIHLAGEWSTGKGTSEEEQVLTPHGFMRAGDVRVGDNVVGARGFPVEVLGVYPQGEQDVFRVAFSDGASVLVDAPHLWAVKSANDINRRADWRVLSTKDLMGRALHTEAGWVWNIPTVCPVDFVSAGALPIHPYVLGVWLGDGTYNAPVYTKPDEGVAAAVRAFLPGGLILRDVKPSRNRKTLEGRRSIVTSPQHCNPYKIALYDLGLLGKRSYERFVPEVYRRAAPADRLLLLQGLMDTDGTVDKRGGSVSYTTTSRQLALDVVDVARALGGLATVWLKDDVHYTVGTARRSGRPAWLVTVTGIETPFLASCKRAKVNRQKRRLRKIVSIEPAGRAQTVCFKVDAPDGQFVMSHYVVTHNSLVLDHLFKSCLDQGGLAMCSETEGSRDPHFADAIGLDLGSVEIQRPESIEEMIDMGLAWHDAIRGSAAGRKVPILWGIDSLDSTEAQKAQDSKGMSGSHGWQYGGGRSEALGAGLRKIVQRTARYPTTFVMLNQTRDNVGVMFGPQKRTSLGNAPHFYASLEIMLAPSPLGFQRAEVRDLKLGDATRKRLGLGDKKHDKGAVVGRWVRAKITKTKIAPTITQEGDFFINFLEGVHRWGGLLAALVRQGAVVMDPDGEAVTHGAEKFPTQKAWLTWLAQHEDALKVPTNLGWVKPPQEETTDAEGE